MTLPLIALLLLLVAIGLAWRRPAKRRTILIGTVFGLPLLAVELAISGGLNHLGNTVGEQLRSVFVTAVSILSIGALAAVLADFAVGRWWGGRAHPSRQRLAWLLVGVAASLLLFVFGQPAPLALMIGLVINAILVLSLEHELVWDATISSLAFAGLFVLADLVLGVRVSGSIDRLLIGPTALGPTIAGLPLERLLTLGLLGAIIGPLFSATKFRRSPEAEQHRSIAAGKILIVIVAGLLMTSSGAWAAATFVLPPMVRTVEPSVQTANVPPVTGLTMVFTRPVDRQSLQVAITPAIEGTVGFEQPLSRDHGYRRAHFTFTGEVPAGTTFHVRISGIRSVWKLQAPEYAFEFSTAPAPATPEPVPTPTPVATPIPAVPTVIPPVVTAAPVTTPPAPKPAVTAATAPTSHVIAVPIDYQDQPLSCEAAALKMALAGKGVQVSESQIMKLVGYDPTPHRGNVWGDPHTAFVGNIAGHRNTTGYGVYWEPILRAASHWRSARIITNSTIQQLAQEVLADHPVVIWGTIGPAYRDDWTTSSGKSILAWKGEHARTVIGVIGPADQPTSFIVNDPVAGRLTWSAAKLNANWASFNRSGVIVQ